MGKTNKRYVALAPLVEPYFVTSNNSERDSSEFAGSPTGEIAGIFQHGIDWYKLGNKLRGLNVEIANDIQNKGQFSYEMGRGILRILTAIRDGGDLLTLLNRMDDLYIDYTSNEEALSFELWDRCKQDFYDNIKSKDKVRGDMVTQFYKIAKKLVSKTAQYLDRAYGHMFTIVKKMESGITDADDNFIRHHLHNFVDDLMQAVKLFADLMVAAEKTLDQF
ncbi:MAG: hypothetical protein ACWA5L_03615 [bacterium]